MKPFFHILAGLGTGLLLSVLLSCTKVPEPAGMTEPAAGQKEQPKEITMPKQIQISISGKTIPVKIEDNVATRALVAALQKASVTYEADDYGGFEKVGALGRSLPASDTQITTQPGDVILYSGNQIVLFYGSNSWGYTRIGKMEYGSLDGLKSFLKAGEGKISVTLSL